MLLKKEEIIGLCINSKRLKCIWLSQTNNSNLIKLKKNNLNNFAIHNLTLYNTQIISDKINYFLNHHKIKNPIFTIVLDSKYILECINTDLIVNKNEYYLLERNLYLNKNKITYKTAIHHSSLLQLKLLSYNNKFNFKYITTEIDILYEAYKSLDNTNEINSNLTVSSLKSFFIKAYLAKNKIIINNKSNYDDLIALGIYHVSKNI